MWLAIDTATDAIGIALGDEQGVYAELQCHADRRHTQALLPGIEALLRLNAIDLAAITGVGVAIGPGSFSGVRVGVAAAKGLCLARGWPLVGVDTFLATAWPNLEPSRPTVALVAAGRGRYLVARFEGAALTPVASAGPLAVAELTPFLQANAFVCGDVAPADWLMATAQFAGASFGPHPAARRRRPSSLALLAAKLMAERGADDLHTLEPIYFGGTPALGSAAVEAR